MRRLRIQACDRAGSFGQRRPVQSMADAGRSFAMTAVVKPQRDVRLDFFRGLALWLIFLDHIPTNVVNSFTLRNYGFSDAAELFVFVSGYTAAFVYGRTMRERGFVLAGARILKRVWQLYIAHVFLFVIFVAEIAYVSRTFDNPLFAEEMNILEFLHQPYETLFQAMLLKFKPANMDILPVYIVLLLSFPPLLWLLLRSPMLALVGSVALYVTSVAFDWYVPNYPSGAWVINPLCWQLLFVFGAWCALYGAEQLTHVYRSPIVVAIAIAYLVFAFAIVISWNVPALQLHVPRWLADFIYPIDKSNLDALRFAHFLALAIVAVRFLPADLSSWKSPLLRPITICGEHSLEIFCLGVFLSFTAHFILVEISGGIGMQILMSAIGIALMTATAALITWYKTTEKRGPAPRQQLPDADIAGGD
jgi:hypothetical protein